MLVQKTSIITGNLNEMEINADPQKIDNWLKHKEGYVQDVFPELNADEREFLISGITSEEWDFTFGSEED